jgi:SEC-C motif-containing protein
LTLVAYYHPLLRQKLEPIKFPLSKQDKQLITDMKYSIQSEQLKNSAAGMAANQWGINKQIFLFCPEADTVNGLEVIINPSYEAINDATTNLPQQSVEWEGCFSVPNVSCKVQRSLHIKVKYQNENGKIIIKELHDWHARVWQHENDHLNGLLFDDPKAGKCIERKQFASKEELNEFYNTLKLEKLNNMPCPCGTGELYKNCCGMLINGEKHADTPEKLMRSRYTAYAIHNMDYIKKTMQGPALLKFTEHNPTTKINEKWLGLKIITSYSDEQDPNIGYVEFIAKFKLNDKEHNMHELSKFQRKEGHWYYIDGKHLP